MIVEKVKKMLRLMNEFTFYNEKNELEKTGEIAREILKIKPHNRAILERIAGFFIDNGLLDEAQCAIKIMNDFFRYNAYFDVLQARVSELLGDYESVVYYADRGIQGELSDWQKALLYNILGRVYTIMGDIEGAADFYKMSSFLTDNPGKIYDYSNYLFVLHYRNNVQDNMYNEICKYNNFFKNITRFSHARKLNHDKIRIGYISPDFRYHIVAFFAYAMLNFYDREHFEIYAYAKCQEDSTSNDLATGVSVWRNIYNITAFDVAKLIYKDEIDILVDLSGHSANNCLEVMAYKPAGIQVSGIGWFDSTGVDAIDYFLTDTNIDPRGKNDMFFTEKLIRLPNTHLCYIRNDNTEIIKISPFLINGYITFGSLNNFAKVSDEVLSVWKEILDKVPNSRLLLKAKAFDILLSRNMAINRLKEVGFDLSRVIIEGYSNDYFKAYEKIDIALDSFPYTGGGTTCDALYMGVPVITLVGKTHASRFGYSILKNVNLEYLCASSIVEYSNICCDLAMNKQLLNRLHGTLRKQFQTSAVMDGVAYMKDLEEEYKKIYIDFNGNK